MTRTSATALTVGGGCSLGAPCNVRFGNVTYALISGATVTLQGGTGTAVIYVDSDGALKVSHNLTLSCDSGCTAAAGTPGVPAGAIPVASWTANAGTWDPAGVDQRAFQVAKSVIAGAGLTSVETGGQTTLSADRTVVGLRVAVPATVSTACVSGSWAADGSYFYVCYNTNQWKRVLLASW